MSPSSSKITSVLAAHCYAAIVTAPPLFPVEARTWWSLEIPALEGMRDLDPLFAPSSTLLLEDAGFLRPAGDRAGSSAESDPPSGEDSGPTPTYSTANPTVAPHTAGETQANAAPPSPVTGRPITPFPTEAGTAGLARPPPTTRPDQAVGPSRPPTSSPETPSPTDWPTLSSSRRYGAANGGCPPGRGLHRLWLYDSAGNGWGSTELVIEEASAPSSSVAGHALFVGTLDANKGVIGRKFSVAKVRAKGPSMAKDFAAVKRDPRPKTRAKVPSMAKDFAEARGGRFSWSDLSPQRNNDHVSGGAFKESEYLCLRRDVCYGARVLGGTFLEGTRWEITRVEMGTGENDGLVAEGVGEASGACDFSLDGSCEKTCDGTPQIIQPTSSLIQRTPDPTKSAPSSSPADAPAVTPGMPTPLPSTFHPTKTPQGKTFAFGINDYIRIRDALLSASPSSKDALADKGSPQSLAFDWMYDGGVGGLSDRRLVQRWALASFYHGAGGDGWIAWDGWMGTGDECDWYGVSCLDGVVSELELGQNRLRGEIVPEIALWGAALHVLSLGNEYDSPEAERNRFVMPLPSFLSDLTYLTYLNLEGVGLTSTIPEELFSSWPHLEWLYLNGNDITGVLPKGIRHLSSIEVIWLGGNNLGGSIVPEIGQLSTLRDLSLESNFREDATGKRGFAMTVPSEIGSLKNLEVLSLAENALSGQVPAQLGHLISLRRLRLNGNFFKGQLPPALGRLEMLEELDISFNWLSSTIPPEYGNMISLTSLSLQSNYNDNDDFFTQGIKNKLPTEIGKLRNIQHIDLSFNYLTGALITEIGQLHLLQTLHLQNNLLEGPLPNEYSNCMSMREFLLQDNNIDGELFSVPEEVCRLPGLDLVRVDCQISCSCCVTTC